MKVYVANNESNIISIIDAKNDTILHNISLPSSVADISVNPNISKVYAISDKSANLYAIDSKNDTISQKLPLPFNATTMAVNPNTNKIYLANYDNWSISVINDSGNNLIRNKDIDCFTSPVINTGYPREQNLCFDLQ